uniref:Uncharacterized protein n=1 Tax=Microcebus murinus TaxID=30608 RepID=A0A8C5VAU2_MICMU
MVEKIEISQYANSLCSFCAVGIWPCGSCMKTATGGAWIYTTTSVTVKSPIRRLKELKDQ